MSHRLPTRRRFVGLVARLSAVVLSALVTLVTLHGVVRIASLEPERASTPVIAKVATTAVAR